MISSWVNFQANAGMVSATVLGGVGANALGRSLLTKQLAMQPATELSAKSLLRGAGFGGIASAAFYGLTHREDSTPAGIAVAFGGGMIAGTTKQCLNYAAQLPNTALPFTGSNLATQSIAAAYGFGFLSWLNVGDITFSNSSWWTTPIFAQPQ